MTEEQIKERISEGFVRLIAAHGGYGCSRLEQDQGVDLVIEGVSSYQRNGRQRFLSNGKAVHIQLKATTESSVVFSDDSLSYDLEAKNFNDLIDRLHGGPIPLVLIVFVLPADKTQWINVTADNLVLRKRAYWFRPSLDETQTQNGSTKRIRIGFANVVDLAFIDSFFSGCFR